MKRSLIILASALALGSAIFAASFITARHATMVCCEQSANDLSWLQAEFHLSQAEMARIRELHESYRPKCAEICAKIAGKRSELDAMLGNRTNITAEAQVKLNEIAALRAQCQTQMLEHFVSVSQAMPPEQGKRYLAEMKRLACCDQAAMEHSMSDETGHEHHH